MIKLIKNFCSSNLFLKMNTSFFIVIYIVLLVAFAYASGIAINNGDQYFELFQNYLSIGHFEQVKNGTSVFYMLTLKVFYLLTNNIKLSFLLLNLVSQLILIYYSFLILKKHSNINNKYVKLILLSFLLYLLNQKYYLTTSNDYFLAIFIVIFIDLLLNLNQHSKYSLFVKIGILSALAISIRATGFLIVGLFLLKFVYYFFSANSSKIIKFKNLLLGFASFIVAIFLLHFPSIIENNKLSFEDKNPKNFKSNWVQRDYLALKKIENKQLKPNRDAIWHYTQFDEVDAYLVKNGVESLPNTLPKFIFSDLPLYLKISIYNFVTCFFRYFRFWGFLLVLFFIPFYKFLYKKQFEFDFKLEIVTIFTIVSFVFSFICIIFIEFRWFVGYEVLIPLGLIKIIENLKNEKKLNLIFSFSLLAVSLFNIKSIISYL